MTINVKLKKKNQQIENPPHYSILVTHHGSKDYGIKSHKLKMLQICIIMNETYKRKTDSKPDKKFGTSRQTLLKTSLCTQLKSSS